MAAAPTTALILSSLSEIPGRMGAIMTPAVIPFSTRSCIASRRAIGLGAPDSLVFHTFSSRLPTLKLILTSATSFSSWRTSKSRRTKTPLVVSDAGFLNSVSTCRIRLVNPYSASAGSYGSEAVPMAMASPIHRGRRSSSLRTSGALTLAKTRCSNSNPGSMPQYSWVGRA